MLNCRCKAVMLAVALVMALPSVVSAQETLGPQEMPGGQNVEDSTFGGWLFTEVSHTFANGVYVTEYLEHDDLQFRRFESAYSRTSVGIRVLPWLKVGVNYVPAVYPHGEWRHYGELDVIGTLSSGNFTVSVRERCRQGFAGTESKELRSRLKVAYSIPDSDFGLYLAPEVFTWGDEWLRTRHYAACTYNISDWVQLEGYYLYYTFNNAPAEHVLGLGLNFSL